MDGEGGLELEASTDEIVRGATRGPPHTPTSRVLNLTRSKDALSQLFIFHISLHMLEKISNWSNYYGNEEWVNVVKTENPYIDGKKHKRFITCIKDNIGPRHRYQDKKGRG